MYEYQGNGLGFSLKPPKWLREAVSNIVGGKPATVPLPTGGAVTVTRGNQPGFPQQAMNFVNEIPTWVPIAAVAALALLVVPGLLRRRG